MPNWALKGCCDKDQKIFLITIAIFTVVIFALWRTFVLTPFKLITVFLHEASHAIACKLTCGQTSDMLNGITSIAKERRMIIKLFATPILTNKIQVFNGVDTRDSLRLVEGIKVHANEGGVTQTRGGIYWLILPAGYLGSSFWGMALILASTTLLTTRIAAGCFIVALIVVLFVAKNWTLRGLCIDIYDDLISRRVNSSDAEKFAELCPCPCNGAAWGGNDLFRISWRGHISWTCHLVLRDNKYYCSQGITEAVNERGISRTNTYHDSGYCLKELQLKTAILGLAFQLPGKIETISITLM
ncbi:unnamed protein product [Camellia sinensis]